MLKIDLHVPPSSYLLYRPPSGHPALTALTSGLTRMGTDHGTEAMDGSKMVKKFRYLGERVRLDFLQTMSLDKRRRL